MSIYCKRITTNAIGFGIIRSNRIPEAPRLAAAFSSITVVATVAPVQRSSAIRQSLVDICQRRQRRWPSTKAASTNSAPLLTCAAGLAAAPACPSLQKGPSVLTWRIRSMLPPKLTSRSNRQPAVPEQLSIPAAREFKSAAETVLLRRSADADFPCSFR